VRVTGRFTLDGVPREVSAEVRLPPALSSTSAIEAALEAAGVGPPAWAEVCCPVAARVAERAGSLSVPGVAGAPESIPVTMFRGPPDALPPGPVCLTPAEAYPPPHVCVRGTPLRRGARRRRGPPAARARPGRPRGAPRPGVLGRRRSKDDRRAPLSLGGARILRRTFVVVPMFPCVIPAFHTAQRKGIRDASGQGRSVRALVCSDRRAGGRAFARRLFAGRG
jgi:hypothetical protein